MFTVQRFPYCGLSMPRVEFGTRQEAREYAAGLLARSRRRYPVQTLKRGAKWEILEPEDAAMVPDACGLVTLRESYRFECPECGQGYDDRDELARCCNPDFDNYLED